jgi:hypothetical protein
MHTHTHTHTPGPWHVNPRGFIVQSTGDIITRLECSNNNDNDARLIAAAPDLLAALIAMMNRYGDKSPHPTCDASISARAALAKAEGVK